MMTRSRAFLVVALPIAILLTAGEHRVRAQSQQSASPPVTEQPMASRSGIDLAALEEAARPSSGAESRKIGDYYASCMDESAIETKGTAPLKADLTRVDAIADKNAIPAVVGHLQTVGTTAFFGFGSAPDFKDATQY